MKDTENKVAVQVKCSSFRYSGYETEVLHDVDFRLEYGRITLLAGTSGCGKSTLLSLINGVIPRMTAGELDGEVRIGGEDIREWSLSRISRRVGSVLQNAEEQIIHQKVEDEIAFACENFAVPPDEIGRRVEDSCHRMKLDPSWKTRTLSGGQKQRLVTASTLAMHTDILLFDEPLANLDQEGAMDLLHLLRSLAEEGKAILLVEHRLDVVLPFADEVWEMKDGRVVRLNDPETYFHNSVRVIRENPVLREDRNETIGSRSAGIETEENPADRKSGEELLSLEGVRKSFGSRVILKSITTDICRGERILLLGENGCGKSTLLKILARLLRKDGGSIRQNLLPESGDLYQKKRIRKNWFQAVGMVYQNPDYQLFMPSVREEILLGASDKTYALDVADRFGLSGLLERHPHSLSEGQKRRVTVAAILAQKPQLLLMDEPTVGQDYEGLQRLLTVMNEIHLEQNNTMISVSHDFRCADALCDRALWLERGEIRKSGGKELIPEFFRGTVTGKRSNE